MGGQAGGPHDAGAADAPPQGGRARSRGGPAEQDIGSDKEEERRKFRRTDKQSITVITIHAATPRHQHQQRRSGPWGALMLAGSPCAAMG